MLVIQLDIIGRRIRSSSGAGADRDLEEKLLEGARRRKQGGFLQLQREGLHPICFFWLQMFANVELGIKNIRNVSKN